MGEWITTHEWPIDLGPVPGDLSVADNCLVSVETRRDAVPWQLIGKTDHAVRIGGHWPFSYQGGLMATHLVLARR